MGANINSTSSPISQALRLLRQLVWTLRRSASHVERETGLSSSQLFVLQVLDEQPADSMNSLAERTMTDQSTVSVIVAKLEARGLVHRDPSAVDARRTTVAITERGQQSLADAPPTVQARLTNALQQLAPDELSALAHGLARLVMLMGATEEPAAPLFEGDTTGSP